MLYETADKIEIKKSKRERKGSTVFYFSQGLLFLLFVGLVVGYVCVLNVLKPQPDMPDYSKIQTIWSFCKWLSVPLALLPVGLIYDFIIQLFSDEYTLVADRHGITVKILFFKQHISWRDLKDYGMSYCGYKYTAFGGIRTSLFSYRFKESRMYKVYFSTQKCVAIADNEKKKLKGVKVFWLYLCPLKMPSMSVNGTTVMEKIFDFCEKKTGIAPFVSETARRHVYLNND